MGIGNSSRIARSSSSCSDRIIRPVFKGEQNQRLKSSVVIAMTLVCSLLGQACFAQPQRPVERLTQGLTERIEFNVNKFNVIGDNPLSESKTNTILAPFLGESRGIDDIENAADALEKVMLEKGSSVYRVSFPPQELTDGTIDLKVTRYKTSDTKVKGTN